MHIKRTDLFSRRVIASGVEWMWQHSGRFTVRVVEVDVGEVDARARLIAYALEGHPWRERSVRPLLVGFSLANGRLRATSVAGQVVASVGRTILVAGFQPSAFVLLWSRW